MKLLNHTTDKVTLELTLHELRLANALIQEGRISHEYVKDARDSQVFI